MPCSAFACHGPRGNPITDDGCSSVGRNPRHRLAFWLGLLLAACLLFAGTTLANSRQAPELVLQGDEQVVPLQPYFDQLRDPRRTLGIDQLLADELAFNHDDNRRDLNFSYTQDVVWLRLKLRSAAKQAQDWRLEFSYSSLDLVEYFEPGPSGLRYQRGGDTLPFAARSVSHRNPVFTLRLEPGETRTLYLRAQSEGSLSLDARLWRADAFQRHSEAGYAVLALYFGMLLALAAYNLLLYFALHERSFLLYVLFVLCFASGLLAINGFGPQYFLEHDVPWANRTLPFGLTLSTAVSSLFTRAFLDTANQAPRWHQVLGIAAALELAATVATLLLPVQNALQMMSFIAIVHTLLLLSCGVGCMVQRVPGARIFVLAWSMMLLGATLLALRNFGVLPSNFTTIHAMQIGSALEMLLLSFALAARFNELKRQKEQAQAANLAAQQQMLQALQEQEHILEQRVAERTEALAAANAQLRELALKDPLTGLANRTALKMHLEAALSRTRRRQDRLALMLVDLDGFKAVNDRLGHEAGDQLLQQIAGRLQDSARESDLVARLGGDEFVLICEGIVDDQYGLNLAERFLANLAVPIRLNGRELVLGASIGVAFSNGSDNDGNVLLNQADNAMYGAKAAGRNRVWLFNRPALHEPSP